MKVDNLVDEPFYVNKCIELLEANLQRGKSAYWKDNDFQKLSNKIHESARISISVPTLKRLFGRIKTHEHYNPQIETKNAIAILLGYEDWQHFKYMYAQSLAAADTTGSGPNTDAAGTGNSHVESVPLPLQEPERLLANGESIPGQKKDARQFFTAKWLGLRAAAVFGLLLLYWLVSGVVPGTAPTPVFKGRNTKGHMPHTVVFDYDVSRLRADTVWVDYDENKRFLKQKFFLPKNKRTITKTFLLPRLYKGKLLAGKDAFPVASVHVLSNGWKAFAFDNDHYFLGPVPATIHQGALHVLHEEVEQAVTLVKNQPYQVEYRNIADFPAVGDYCRLETRIKINPQNMLSCRDFSFQLLGDERNVRVTLVKPGCYGWVRIEAGEVFLNGNFQDLSAFAQELAEWRTLRLEVKDGKAVILLDEKRIYEISYQEAIGPVKGIIYGFNGGGAIDYVKLYNAKGTLVYADYFE